MSDLLIKTKKLLLVLGDLAVFYFSLYLTMLIRYGETAALNWQEILIPFSVVFIFWLIIIFINDLYDLKISYNVNSLLSNLITVMIINGLIAVVIFYFFSPIIGSIRPQRVLLIDLIVTFFVLFLWRRFFFRFIKSAKINNQVLILGNNELGGYWAGQDLAEEIGRRPQLGYQARIIYQLPDDLKQYCQIEKINTLVIAQDLKNDPAGQEKIKKIFDCLPLGIDVFNINNFYEQITNKVPIEYINQNWFLENLAEHSKKFYEIIKRIVDVVLAIIGLIIALPFCPVIALIIKLETPGPVIFRQIRTGKNGKSFLAMKFRSMIKEAEKNGAQWAQKNDPRITRFGLFMRKTRLDEIPQLFNILRGEMSFVGPRPERPEFIGILEQVIPFYKERLLVKPGLAGWAQLKGPAYGGSKEETLEKLKYDLYYIKNRSLIFDLSIILKTLRLVFKRKGQ